MLKSTLSLGQIVVLFEVIVIVGVTLGMTVTVLLAFAIFGLAQARLLVISTRITSLSTRPVLE